MFACWQHMLRFQRTQREQPAAEPEPRGPAVRLPESIIEHRQASQEVLPWLSYQTIMEVQAAGYDVQQGAGQVVIRPAPPQYAPWVSAALAAVHQWRQWQQAPDGSRAVQAQQDGPDN